MQTPEHYSGTLCNHMISTGTLISYRCTRGMGHTQIPANDPEPHYAVEASLSAQAWSNWKDRQDARSQVGGFAASIPCPSCKTQSLWVDSIEGGNHFHCTRCLFEQDVMDDATEGTNTPAESGNGYPWVDGCDWCSRVSLAPEYGLITWHQMVVNHFGQEHPGPQVIAEQTDSTEHFNEVSLIAVDADDDPPSTEPTKQRDGDQRLPDADASQLDDFEFYISDIRARRDIGIDRYGQAHRPFNGRNTLLDAYEEVLDTGLYLRSLLRQAAADREILVGVVEAALSGLGIAGTYEKSGQREAAEIAVDRIMGWVVTSRETTP